MCVLIFFSKVFILFFFQISHRVFPSWSAIDYASREKHRDVVRILQDEGAVLAVLEQLEERRKAHEASIAKVPKVKIKRSLFVDPEKAAEDAKNKAEEDQKASKKRENVSRNISVIMCVYE